MAIHVDRGKQGEELAEAFLVNKGFMILHRNWRHSHYEIDLIAIKDDLLHFIEVKYRSTDRFGHPEGNVSKKKIKFLLQAVDEYLFLHPQFRNFHIDILSITGKKNGEPEYFFIEDVYL
jgi:putative endonuclease